MALLLPVALIVVLIVLALRYRSRDGGLQSCLWRIEQTLRGAMETGVTPSVSAADIDALRESPEHLYRLVMEALASQDADPKLRALAAIREYRDFRGWRR